ncbi:MAG TPA: valine--tRNA ligase [Phycisphaerae bacterium]|nr:valine--tRNA ligase [Phycisphaerae bacterium]
MAKSDSKSYDPAAVERRLFEYWEDTGHFKAQIGRHAEPFCMVIPPPNVTGALHLGHALNNTLQDILIRRARMQGKNTFWLVGTDHAGIATQATVEKTIRKTEGKSRHDLGRDELVRRIWEWKEKYGGRIIEQLRLMGCSCDYSRERFTLDEGCVKAVRETFFKLFRDGLIYRGKRLVNWDTELQTAVADDEVYHETVKGHFYHLKYPLVQESLLAPTPSEIPSREPEPEFVHVATTRPETMLGDTAVAVHPDPAAALDSAEKEALAEFAESAEKDRAAKQAKIDDIRERRTSLLPTLLKLRDMAKAGRKVILPLTNREIPLVLDEWANPALGTGCVKITPAHDPNDYDVAQRQPSPLPMINVLSPDGKIAEIIEPDGTVNPASARYAGLKFATAGREKVVEDLQAGGFIEKIEDRQIEIGHSDRSKSMIEPFLSDQWFVKMGDVAKSPAVQNREAISEPEALARESGAPATSKTEPRPSGSGNRLKAEAPENLNPASSPNFPGLAQLAIDAEKRGDVKFHPARYEKTYTDWLSEKRDWCISRQLWWGHRIPVWSKMITWGNFDLSTLDFVGFQELESNAVTRIDRISDGRSMVFGQFDAIEGDEFNPGDDCLMHIGLRADTNEIVKKIEQLGFVQDPDVLDTWFSSALWPISTLGWPDARATRHTSGTAARTEVRGSSTLASASGSESGAGATETEPTLLSTFYPTNVLSTAREIITLWVARMVMFGLYNTGEVPFADVVIHPVIQDGQGRKMSKSLGNGVDPVDIIDKYGADALRFILAELATETQDIRMPVTEETLADGRKINISPKFEKGRNFCNKLWQAATGYVLPNLEGREPRPLTREELKLEDRWILSRMTSCLKRVDAALEKYHFSEAVGEMYHFMWDDYCSAYLEMTKPRMTADDAGVACQVLAFVLDRTLRMLHPVTPFITEAAWEELRRVAPIRGLFEMESDDELLISSRWPAPDESLFDPNVEREMQRIQEIIKTGREIRTVVNEYRGQTKTPSIRTLPLMIVTADPSTSASFNSHADFIRALAGCDALEVTEADVKPQGSFSRAIGPVTIHVPVGDLIDLGLVRAAEQKKLGELQGALERTEKQLSNRSFVERADPGIVEQARQRATELRHQIESAQRHIAELA